MKLCSWTSACASVGVALLLAGAPAEAHGGAIGSAVRNAIAKRAAKASAPVVQTAFGAPTIGKPKDVVIKRSAHPQAAAHIEHAQRLGQPTVLHIDRNGAATRRHTAIGTVDPKRKPAPRYERDEYPPAFTREGGANASVRFINFHDNRGAGAAMRTQTRELPDGSKIRVLVQ